MVTVVRMALIDDLQQLSSLHANGSLSDAEFIAAKQQLLQSSPQADAKASERLTLEAELARIDREFTLEREQCLVASRYGHRHEPSRAMRFIIPLFAIAWLLVGGFIFSMFSQVGGSMALLPAGIMIVGLVGMGFGFFNNESKLSRLEAAKEEHASKRARVMQKLGRSGR